MSISSAPANATPASAGIGTLPFARIRGLSGQAVLEALVAGELPRPPITGTLDFILSEVGEGRVVFTGEPLEAHLNPLGTIHGGWISTLLDSAMGCAVHSMLKPGQIYTTTSMTVNFVRALMPGSGPVRCEGVSVHAGGRVGTAEGRLFDSKGRLVAHGSETCLIMDAAPPAAKAAG